MSQSARVEQPVIDQPIRLEPALLARPWGGNRLARWIGALPTSQPIGEAWCCSDRAEGMAMIASGPSCGRPLSDLVRQHPFAIGGSTATRLPLLFKLLDCSETLSVQVHPDDTQAAPAGDLGKEEAWVVLEADPGAEIFLGFADPVTPSQIQTAALDGSLPSLLRRETAAPGDVFHIPPGTVHALGAGIVLAEIQQSSNLTYRLYDWQRLGLDGRPRPLHIDSALQVCQAQPTRHRIQTPATERLPGGTRWPLIAGQAFRLDRYEIDGTIDIHCANRPLIIFIVSGTLELGSGRELLPLTTGQTALLPAAAGASTLIGLASVLVARPSSP